MFRAPAFGGHLVQLFELAQAPGRKPFKVDRAKGIIYRTKILGERSLNPPPDNNVYPRSTRERVIPAMEGARANVDHLPRGQSSGRSYRDSIGIHRNVREEGDGLYSDFHVNKGHPLAEQVLWDAEHAPENVGFSIASQGRKVARGGDQVVEEIVFDKSGHSIDLVSRGATTSSLYESWRGSPGYGQPAVNLLTEAYDESEDGRRRRLARWRGDTVLTESHSGAAGPQQSNQSPEITFIIRR